MPGIVHLSNPLVLTAQVSHTSTASPAVDRLRQEDCSELKANLGYVACARTTKAIKVEFCQNNNNNNHKE